MLKLSIPQINNKVFFETTLEPPKSIIDEVAKVKDMGEVE